MVDIYIPILPSSTLGNIICITASEAAGDGRRVITVLQSCVVFIVVACLFRAARDKFTDRWLVQIVDGQIDTVVQQTTA